MVMSYADQWHDAINETYPGYDPDDMDAAQVLARAAACLRNGVPATFTGPELDLVRHLMPAHEVHQSGAKRWVLANYGRAPK